MRQCIRLGRSPAENCNCAITCRYFYWACSIRWCGRCEEVCAASALPRVQSQICGRAVSLGSFSEAQALVEPELLQEIFSELSEQVLASKGAEKRGPRQPALAGAGWEFIPGAAEDVLGVVAQTA